MQARHRPAARPAELRRRLARLDQAAASRCRTTASTSPTPWPARRARTTRCRRDDPAGARWTICATSRATIRSWYSAEVRQTLSAYALYVRHAAGRRRPRQGPRAPGRVPGWTNQSLEALAWLWQVLADDPASTDRRWRRSSGTSPTARWRRPARPTSSPPTATRTTCCSHSDRRTDAIVLEALISEQPGERPDPQGGARAAGAPRRRAAGATPRRTSSSCWRWTATSTPSRT